MEVAKCILLLLQLFLHLLFTYINLLHLDDDDDDDDDILFMFSNTVNMECTVKHEKET